MKSLALSSIRKQNLSKVLDLLTFSPALTRQDLADATALSQMTVTNLVELLKKQGVLRLTPMQRDEGSRHPQGRKADAISLSGEEKAWLIVNISSRQFSMWLLGFDLAPLLELHDDQQGEYLPRLESFLQESRPKVLSALQSRELLGVAIVTPGPYEISSDTVNNQRLPQLNGVRVKELFRRCLGPYEYYVDEDVKFAVRAFSDLIVLNQCEVLYYLYIGEGVGGAAVHGGNMLRGLNATAGDAGHLTGRACSTFESRLSTEAFLRQLDVPLPVSAEKLPALLEQLAREHPQRYTAALDAMAAVTAEMLHGVLWLLDPTHIIVDCVYARPVGDAFVQAVEGHLSRLFQGETRLLPQLIPCEPGVSSVLRGAVSVLQRAWLERLLM
ncbi:MAG: ROK family transcriptional regulator [Clostridiales bacterium]|nr:ROK family transcriptional regulator [Clostridiales bacterium]